MRFIVNRIVVSFLLVTLAGAAAFANTKTRMVTFASDVRVNGTLVKKGNYKVKFDEMSGQLSIEKHGKVIATTATRLEKRDRKAQGLQVVTREAEMGLELISVTFGGSDQNIVVNQTGMQAGGN
jgi:hypothetical protein